MPRYALKGVAQIHCINGNEAMKQECKTFANKLTKLKAIAKKNYYTDKVEKNKSSSRKTWELLQTLLLGKFLKSSNLPTSIRVNERKITEKQLVLEEFNKYLSNIGENLAAKFESDNAEACKLHLHQRWNRSGFSRPDPTGKFQNHRRLTGRSTGF